MANAYPLSVILVAVDPAHLPELRVQLSRMEADVESEFPTAGAMMECLRRSRERTQLLILEIGEGCDEPAVMRLGTYFAGWLILALMPEEATLADVQRIYRAGARQVVQLPIRFEDIEQAFRQIALQVDSQARSRKTFAVAGVNGGCGTSTLAINVAYEIAHRYRRSTILAELTLQVGALSSMLDIDPNITLPYLLQNIQRVDSLLLEKALISYDDLRILSGATQVGPAPAPNLSDISRIVEGLRGLSDITVLDVPGTFHDQDLGILYSADQAVLVGLQNVPSIRSLKLLCEMFPEERINHSLWIAINRYDPHLNPYTHDRIKEMLGAPNVVTIANDYNAAIRAINSGQPLRKAAPETPILRGLDRLIRSLLGVEEEPAEKRNGLLRRVKRALSL